MTASPDPPLVVEPHGSAGILAPLPDVQARVGTRCPLLDVQTSPLDVLRQLRDRPGLVGLIGAWAGGGAIIACDPVEVLEPTADPFEVLARSGSPCRAANEPAHPADYPPDRPAGNEPAHPPPRPYTAGAGPIGGGWFGFWGYPAARRLERLPDQPRSLSPPPDHWLGRYEWVLRADGAGRWSFESLLGPAESQPTLDRLRVALAALPPDSDSCQFGPFTMTPTAAQHQSAVARAIRHIEAGDIFQVNLCASVTAQYDGDPLAAFCAGVQQLAPAYAAFLDTGTRVVASLSPELFLRRVGRTVTTSPIKGTAPLDTDPGSLAGSEKDRAENIMIVDLMRNDLGRVCVPGSVTVTALARPEARAGVWHLVSDVAGRLPAHVTDADLMRATFPPGSITGAPKIRAMELIDDLESVDREVYTGAIGYASPQAGLETSVVIRTLEFGTDSVTMGVGGGIVAASSPAAELAECMTKAAPILAAIGAQLPGAPLLGAAGLAESAVATATGSAAPSSPGAPAARNRLARAAAEAGPRPALPADRSGSLRPDPAAGVITTLRVRGGAPVLADAHLDRVCASAVRLGFPADRARLARLLRQGAAGRDTCRTRLTVSPEGVGVDVAEAPQPEHRRQRPWHLEPTLLPGGLGSHKWADRAVLDHLLGGRTTCHCGPVCSRPAFGEPVSRDLRAHDPDSCGPDDRRPEIREPSAYERELLLVDHDGTLLETARGTLFLVAGSAVHTPRADGRILPGIARNAVMDLLRRQDIPVYERDIDLAEIADPTEVFLANAVRGVIPASTCPASNCPPSAELPDHSMAGRAQSLLETAWGR